MLELKEAHNLKYLLIRAQPYINYQEKLLAEEREILDLIGHLRKTMVFKNKKGNVTLGIGSMSTPPLITSKDKF